MCGTEDRPEPGDHEEDQLGPLGPPGPGQVTELPREALLLGVGEPLALPVVGELLGELIHGGLLPWDGGWLVVVLYCHGPGRAVTIRSRAQERHRIEEQD